MNEIELEFTKLVREYRKTIYTVCYFFSDNPADVEDLFQEVLVNLWKGFAKFRGDSSPKTWIWRVSLLTSGMRHPKYLLRSNSCLMARCSSVRKRV